MKIAANGIDLEITQAGSGARALVFSHFWGGSSREWSSVIDGLASRYHCVAVDSRGSGGSDAPSAGYRITDLADDLAGVIAALKLKRYVLVGHSMGGKTSQVLASRRPAGLRGLALVASSPPSPMPSSEAQRSQMKSAYARRESINWALDNVLTSSPISDQDRELVIADALRVSPAARDGWVDIASQEDYANDVATVNVPVTIVAGELDKVDPLELVKAHIIAAFRNPEIHFLPKKGHLLPIEAPVELVEILGKFAAAAFV